MSPLLTPTMPPADPDHPVPFGPGEYPPTLLLRIYGPSSDALISRSEELRILTVLSTQYGLGPKVYGTFENGRVEQFFPSRALHAEELRDVKVSRGIARRMRELHSVDLNVLGYGQGGVTLWKCLDDWIELAEGVVSVVSAMGGQWEVWAESFGLHRLRKEIEAYRKFAGDSAVVFAREYELRQR
jgi:choline kinase